MPLPPEAFQKENANHPNHDLNRRENAVEIDSFIEAALRNQPRMRSSVGKMEVDRQECSANGGNGGEEEDGCPHSVGNAIPGAEPDERTDDQSYSGEHLGDLNEIAEDLRIGDKNAFYETAIPLGRAHGLLQQLVRQPGWKAASNKLGDAGNEPLVANNHLHEQQSDHGQAGLSAQRVWTRFPLRFAYRIAVALWLLPATRAGKTSVWFRIMNHRIFLICRIARRRDRAETQADYERASDDVAQCRPR